VSAALDAGTGRRGQGEWWWLVALAAVLLAAFPYFEQTRNANERPRMLQAAALLEQGTWAIDGQIRRGLEPGPDVSRDPRTGALYPNKPPGTTVVAAVGVAAAEVGQEEVTLRRATWFARLLGGVLPTILLCGWLGRRLARGPGGTLALAIYALATPAAAYAHLLYGHQLTACLLWIGAVLVVDAVREDRRGYAALGGCLAAASVTVEYAAAFAGIPLAVFVVVWMRRRWQAALAATAGAIGPIALLGLYHAQVYGSPLRTGYHLVIDAGFAAKHGEGFLGLVAPSWQAFHAHVLSCESGLLWWAPLAVVGLAGLIDLSFGPDGRERSHARVHLAIFAGLVAICASLNFEGGWRVGPRYLVAVLPGLVLGWCHALRWVFGPERPAWRAGLWMMLLTWSAIINGLAANLWPHFDLTNINQPVSEVLLPLWRAGFAPYMAVDVGVTTVLVVTLVGLLAIVGVLATRAQLIFSVVGMAVGIGMVAATTAIPPHPRSAANLRYIEKVWEPPGSSAVLVP